eukprot:SAG25_NODE_410_length_8423_cov_2.086617_5_plen_54_part_00
MLSDEEFQTLVAVVDYNNNGTIEYIEFAETMKVNDVQVGGSFVLFVFWSVILC